MFKNMRLKNVLRDFIAVPLVSLAIAAPLVTVAMQPYNYYSTKARLIILEREDPRVAKRVAEITSESEGNILGRFLFYGCEKAARDYLAEN